MSTLIITPNPETTPDERAHNKALIDRYVPDFPKFFLDAREMLGAKMGPITIKFPESDLPFVQSMMDSTKKLLK